MRRLIKNSLCRLLSTRLSIDFFIRHLRSTVTVLMYHGIAKDDEKLHSWTLVKASEFEQQILLLKQYFHIISINDLASMDSCSPTDEKPLLVITFDDGLKNNLTVALPLLEKHNIPATIYISTGAVQENKIFWWDKITEMVLAQKRTELNLDPYALGTHTFDHNSPAEATWEPVQALLERMKSSPSYDRQLIADTITERYYKNKASSDSPFNVLTPEEVSHLSNSPLITIGSHSHCHSILTQIPYQAVEESIKTSLDLLEEWTGNRVCHFSYPNGNYDHKIIAILKKYHIETAVTTRRGRWQPGTHKFEINRIAVGGYDRFAFFKYNVTGGKDVISRVTRVIR